MTLAPRTSSSDDDVDGPRVPVQVTRGCVVAGIQVDLSPGLLTRLQTDVLARVSASGVRKPRGA